MIHTAEVYLWDARIGILHQNGSDKAPVFEYDRDYIRSGIELAPFRMPLSEQIYSFPELVDSAAHSGMDITFVTSSTDNKACKELLSAMGMPFAGRN